MSTNSENFVKIDPVHSEKKINKLSAAEHSPIDKQAGRAG